MCFCLLNTIGIIMGIIGAAATIFQTVKPFIKKESTSKVQQNNINGNNTYIDKSMTINESKTVISVNPTPSKTSDVLPPILTFFVGTVLVGVILAAYQLTYMFIPALCITLLSINVYRDSKLSFENNTAKTHWAFKNIIILVAIVFLMLIPTEILKTINQIPTFHFKNINVFLDSIFNNVSFLTQNYNQNLTLTLSLIFRMIITFGLFIFLFQSIFIKKDKNKPYDRRNILQFFIITTLMIIGLNFELFLDLTAPYRSNITSWLNPPQ